MNKYLVFSAIIVVGSIAAVQSQDDTEQPNQLEEIERPSEDNTDDEKWKRLVDAVAEFCTSGAVEDEKSSDNEVRDRRFRGKRQPESQKSSENEVRDRRFRGKRQTEIEGIDMEKLMAKNWDYILGVGVGLACAGLDKLGKELEAPNRERRQRTRSLF